MPYADPEDKRWQMKRWREEHIKQGYGKWLYARRKLRFDDAERFREALEKISTAYTNGDAEPLQRIALDALEESRQAEEALGQFQSQI
jgi:hypothetical protein